MYEVTNCKKIIKYFSNVILDTLIDIQNSLNNSDKLVLKLRLAEIHKYF